MTRLPIVWQRLVSAGKMRAVRRHRGASANRRLQVAAGASALNIEPTLEVREINQSSFKETPSESNRIWVAGNRSRSGWVQASEAARAVRCAVNHRAVRSKWRGSFTRKFRRLSL
jgi:hypothetical protein